MEEKQLVGKKATYVTTLTLEEDGTWKAEILAKHGKLFEGDDEWKEKSAGVKAFHNDPDRALAVVTDSMNRYLTAVNFDLLSEQEEDGSKTGGNKAKTS